MNTKYLSELKLGDVIEFRDVPFLTATIAAKDYSSRRFLLRFSDGNREFALYLYFWEYRIYDFQNVTDLIDLKEWLAIGEELYFSNDSSYFAVITGFNNGYYLLTDMNGIKYKLSDKVYQTNYYLDTDMLEKYDD